MNAGQNELRIEVGYDSEKFKELEREINNDILILNLMFKEIHIFALMD